MLFPFPDNILKLTAGSLERVPYCHIDILVGPVRRGLTAHRDFGRIRNHETNPDVKDKVSHGFSPGATRRQLF